MVPSRLEELGVLLTPVIVYEDSLRASKCSTNHNAQDFRGDSHVDLYNQHIPDKMRVSPIDLTIVPSKEILLGFISNLLRSESIYNEMLVIRSEGNLGERRALERYVFSESFCET